MNQPIVGLFIYAVGIAIGSAMGCVISDYAWIQEFKPSIMNKSIVALKIVSNK